MKVQLAYGKTGVEVEVPDDSLVLQPKRLLPVEDPAAAIVEALRDPMGTRQLRDLVSPQDTVAIVFSDITRPIPNDVVLPPLLAELEAAGVQRPNITLINGLAMHRPNTREELLSMLGPQIMDNYRITQHKPEDPDRLTYLMTNDRGIDVSLNSAYMSASVRILTGFIEPHIFAGWSGGGKSVLPAIANAEAVMSNHSGPMLAHPAANWCRTTDNPIFTEMREVAQASQPTFVLNVTLDERKQLTGVFAGELRLAHDAGIAFAEGAFVQDVPHEFDIALTAHMGYPSDINLYQSVKALSVAAQAVRQGGAVILCAECPDGLGLPHFADLLGARSSPPELLEMVEDPEFSAFDQWGVQVTAMCQVKVNTYLYSSMSEAETRRAFMEPVHDISRALKGLLLRYRTELGREPRVLVLPYGQLTVPRLSAAVSG